MERQELEEVDLGARYVLLQRLERDTATRYQNLLKECSVVKSYIDHLRQLENRTYNTLAIQCTTLQAFPHNPRDSLASSPPPTSIQPAQLEQYRMLEEGKRLLELFITTNNTNFGQEILPLRYSENFIADCECIDEEFALGIIVLHSRNIHFVTPGRLTQFTELADIISVEVIETPLETRLVLHKLNGNSNTYWNLTPGSQWKTFTLKLREALRNLIMFNDDEKKDSTRQIEAMFLTHYDKKTLLQTWSPMKEYEWIDETTGEVYDTIPEAKEPHEGMKWCEDSEWVMYSNRTKGTVQDVKSWSPAYISGVQSGDRIVSFRCQENYQSLDLAFGLSCALELSIERGEFHKLMFYIRPEETVTCGITMEESITSYEYSIDLNGPWSDQNSLRSKVRRCRWVRFAHSTSFSQ